MNLQFAQAWAAITASPLFGVTLTLVAYQAARSLWRRTRGNSLANPVLVAVVIVVAVLLLFNVSYDDYFVGAQYISFLLGPAFIRMLRRIQMFQVIREEGPKTHQAKAGTPTMGGLLILTAVLVP